MKLKKIIVLIGLLTTQLAGLTQSKISDVNFDQVDAFARSVKYDNDLATLTNKLTAPYTDSLYKLRAIFIWITDNIAYDYKLLNSGDDKWSRFSCTGTKATCDAAITAWENDFLDYVLSKKKGLCSGYAKLFKKMCDIAGIKNERVAGYVKKSFFQIGLVLNVTHDWNIVTIGGKSFACDATWAAGICKTDEESGKPTDFVKLYQDFFWLTPYNKFARNHYPKDSRWVLEGNATKEDFFNAPFFYPGEFTQNIESVLPDNGVIKSKIGDTIHFKFACKYQVKKIELNTNNYKMPDILFTSQQLPANTIYKFDYVVKENSLYYIEILFDSRKVIRYKISY
jgi:transglutaminase/protease-like cytokinesis protein 3